jgi:hypothetical protein
MYYTINARIAGQGFLLPKIVRIAQLAITSTLLAVLANNQLLKVADWAFK